MSENQGDSDDTLRIGEKVFDLRPLRDPPIGFWELLEKRGLLSAGGELQVRGLSQGFDFLHYALCATTSLSDIDAMAGGGEPPIPRSVVTGIPTSQLQKVMDKVSGVLGVDGGDASKVRPSNGRSSRRRTSSAARTDGRSPTSGL